MTLQSQAPSTGVPRREMLGKLLRFMVAGGPAFLIAVPLNGLLVTGLHAPKALAYALVILLQSTANFFVCRWFVFREARPRPMWSRFAKFAAIMFSFRAVDWAVYVCGVEYCAIPYLAMQFGNMVVFSLLKFSAARRVMEK